MHDGTTSFRIEIAGSLSGNAVRQLEQSWDTASSVIGNRMLVIVVGNLSNIDTSGRALLHKWQRAGAQFVAKSPLASTLIGSIVGQPVVSETASIKFAGWDLFRPLLPLITLFFPTVQAASLEPTTLAAWEAYIASANIRMEQRLSPDHTFLWVDEKRDRLARVRGGEIVVSAIGPQNPKRVPSGLIHDWVGAAFIANVSLNDVLEIVRDYARYKDFYQPTVIDSKVTATRGTSDSFSLLLMNKSLFLETALDTDYESCYVHVDDRRGYSISRTTRIQEIEEYGTRSQHALGEGRGNGIIWRLLSIAPYVERDGGVYVELEAIGLSRDIPASFRWAVEPIVRRLSRGSLSTSLRQTENAVRLRAEIAKRLPAGDR